MITVTMINDYGTPFGDCYLCIEGIDEMPEIETSNDIWNQQCVRWFSSKEELLDYWNSFGYKHSWGTREDVGTLINEVYP